MSGEGFLSRWSRRKRGGAEEGPEIRPSEEPSAAPEAVPAAAPEPAACPLPGVPEFDLASLPKVEELTIASDLGPFLRPGVPAALRAAALRRMWSLDPAIRDYIGPVEYQWDFNVPGGLPAGFASELVGDVKKLLAQAIGMEEREEAAPEAEEEIPALPEAPAEAPPESPLRLDDQAPAEPVAEPLLAEEAPMPRRRHGGALPS